MGINAYYNTCAKNYFDRKILLSRQHLYNWFMPYIKRGGKVLDAGCGPGLDIQAFLNQGFVVEAFEASSEMVKLAIQHTQHQVSCLKFEELEKVESFDAIWANASLVHYSSEELPEIFFRFLRALKYDGYWYMVFRHGSGVEMHDQIPFYKQTENSLQSI